VIRLLNRGAPLFAGRRNTVSVGLAGSTEGTRLEAGAAFGW
jgi:hypothetical protein